MIFRLLVFLLVFAIMSMICLSFRRRRRNLCLAKQPMKLIKTIKTGNGAHAFRAAGDKRHVFVSNRVANTINKIDLQTLEVVATIAVPGGPDCMDVSADGRYIFVASRWAQFLTVIDTTTRKVVRQVKVGNSPHGVWTLEHANRQ